MAEWYLAVPEYNRCIIALTFPNMLAYIRAEKRITNIVRQDTKNLVRVGNPDNDGYDKIRAI